jgi:hypothetical protein
MVHPERFERPTYWFVASCSIQLSYGCTYEELRSGECNSLSLVDYGLESNLGALHLRQISRVVGEAGIEPTPPRLRRPVGL